MVDVIVHAHACACTHLTDYLDKLRLRVQDRPKKASLATIPGLKEGIWGTVTLLDFLGSPFGQVKAIVSDRHPHKGMLEDVFRYTYRREKRGGGERQKECQTDGCSFLRCFFPKRTRGCCISWLVA